MARDRAARARRRFVHGSLTLAGLGLLTECGVLFPPWQQPTKIHRLGFLSGGAAALNAADLDALRQGLRELGYAEGQLERSAELVPLSW
jgi:hypothetical protein